MASKNKPQESLDKIDIVENAWKTLRPAKTFAGFTLEQFQAKLKPSRDARAEIARLDAETKAAQNRRDVADAESLKVIDRVVKSVVADEDEGDDGDLYETMGYVRKSEARSGLTRRKAVAPATPA
ncbi:MAG: hypothetical protein WC661_08525 [Opitutaceae bacterium]|jgi:hypothetical protein